MALVRGEAGEVCVEGGKSCCRGSTGGLNLLHASIVFGLFGRRREVESDGDVWDSGETAWTMEVMLAHGGAVAGGHGVGAEAEAALHTTSFVDVDELCHLEHVSSASTPVIAWLESD